jgi:hypothetical protein
MYSILNATEYGAEDRATRSKGTPKAFKCRLYRNGGPTIREAIKKSIEDYKKARGEA